jgi:hypothetical protein
MTEAVKSFEMSVSYFETARRNIPEGCRVYTGRCNNLKYRCKYIVSPTNLTTEPFSAPKYKWRPWPILEQGP